MNSQFTFNKKLLIQGFFFLTFAFLLYQLFVLVKPFFGAFLMAAILAIAFHPLNLWVKRQVKNPTLASLILTSAIFLLAVGPLVMVGLVLIHEAEQFLPQMRSFAEALKSGNTSFLTGTVPAPFQWAAEKALAAGSSLLTSATVDIKSALLDNLQQASTHMISTGGLIARNLFLSVVFALALIIALFFALRDGETLVQKCLELLPMKDDHKNAVARKAYETFRAVSVGVFLTAAAQGFTAMVGFWIAGVRLPVILGFATMMTSLFGASFIVTFPAAIIVLANDRAWGIFLLLWGGVVVGFMDNFLRPYLIGSRMRMPFFLMLFSILAGIKAYGLLGIVLGPALIGVIITFVKIYRQEYGTGQKP